eukprot:2183646-Amphidinium_carterae.1
MGRLCKAHPIGVKRTAIHDGHSCRPGNTTDLDILARTYGFQECVSEDAGPPPIACMPRLPKLPILLADIVFGYVIAPQHASARTVYSHLQKDLAKIGLRPEMLDDVWEQHLAVRCEVLRSSHGGSYAVSHVLWPAAD